jgi:hypothetical protein
VLITGTTPGGAAGGDLAGTYPDPTIRVGAVVTDRIADAAVTTAKINDAAVTTPKIADDAVTTAKLNATGVNAGTYGSSNKIARVTVDTKGRVTSADSVAIDVSSSSWMLEGNNLADSSTKWIGTQNATPLVVKTNGAERMRVTGGGWVGIGTATPSAALHVAGKSILIDDDVKVGGNNRNTFLGREVLTIPTVGWGNVGVGNGAGRYLTGFANVALGESALFRSTSDGNVSIGFMSMFESTAGWHNVAIGERAMQNATTGGDNIAIGWSALGNVGSGTSNLGVGGSALSNNSGSSNTAIGVAAASMQTSGNFNTFVGNSAGHGLLSGDFNTIIAVNYQNGTLGLTSGNANTIIGSRITGLSATLNNNIIIADGEGNRRVNVDNVGRIGLGVNTPLKKLHVAGSKDSSDIRFDALAHSSTATTPTGSYGIVIADSLGNIHRRSAVSVIANTAWLTAGNAQLDSTSCFMGTADASPLVIKTNSIERVRVTAAGAVGIGTATPAAKLDVADGDLIISNANSAGVANKLVMQGTTGKTTSIKAGDPVDNFTYTLPNSKPIRNGMALTSDTMGVMTWNTASSSLSYRLSSDVIHTRSTSDTTYKVVFTIPASELSGGSNYEFRAQLFLTSNTAPGELDVRFRDITNVVDTSAGISYNFVRQGGGFNAIDEMSVYAAKTDADASVKSIYTVDGRNYGSGQPLRGGVLFSGHLLTKASPAQNLIFEVRVSSGTATTTIKKNSFIVLTRIN